ncbi:RNA polymerase sigma factor [Hymenobacter radiodurans]|uniref:RNA polymerase sigma factor n=1 Tax=Hymenobacter radiodurans TaxID=2496028 RepID=UPI001404CFC4|nr:sigma-70 family RNA polymerase sigma factor [Hymenobacter radiodurans]
MKYFTFGSVTDHVEPASNQVMAPVADKALIEQVVGGQTAAFAVLLNRYQHMAFQIAYRLLRHRELAEEVTQDAFLKAYHALPTFKGDAKFSTWLYRIVYTTAVSRGRKKELLTEALPTDDDSSLPSVVDTTQDQLQRLAEQDQKAYLEAALATLPADDHLLMTLYYEHEHSVEEISHITGASKANVKVRLLRTRRKLYTALHLLLKQELPELL